VQELISVTRSDLRNIKQQKSDQISIDEFFDKIYLNLKEKQDSLDKFKEFLSDYQQQTKSQQISNSRDSLSQDPFRQDSS
jgi:hypothetical protein